MNTENQLSFIEITKKEVKPLIILICIALLFCFPVSASDDTNTTLNESAGHEFNQTVDNTEINDTEQILHNGPCGYIIIDYPVESLREYYESMGISNPDDTPLLTQSSLQSSADTAYDLRNEYAVTSVKSQVGDTCWMYSVIGAAESSILKAAVNAGYSQEYVRSLSQTLDLSELQAGYFFYNRNGVTVGTVPNRFSGLVGDNIEAKRQTGETNEPTYVSRGGNANHLAHSLEAGIGLVEETALLDDSLMKSPETYLLDASNAKADYYVSGVTLVSIDDREKIQEMIQTKGAGVIAYTANGLCYYLGKNNEGVYWKGIRSETFYYDDERYVFSHENEGGHGVCVVGWDDAYPAENFKFRPPGNGAWLMKNNWGENWDTSDGGYFWISYYDTSLTDVIFFDVVPASSYYDYIYQYDGGALNTFLYTSSTASSITARNIYTAVNNQKITKVGFETVNLNLNYKVEIIKDGRTVSTKSGFLSEQGYHTIDLSNPVSVNAKESFEVLVTLSGRTNIIFPADTSADWGWIKFTSVTTGTNSSYYTGTDTGNWNYIMNDGNNFRIKG